MGAIKQILAEIHIIQGTGFSETNLNYNLDKHILEFFLTLIQGDLPSIPKRILFVHLSKLFVCFFTLNSIEDLGEE